MMGTATTSSNTGVRPRSVQAGPNHRKTPMTSSGGGASSQVSSSSTLPRKTGSNNNNNHNNKLHPTSYRSLLLRPSSLSRAMMVAVTTVCCLSVARQVHNVASSLSPTTMTSSLSLSRGTSSAAAAGSRKYPDRVLFQQPVIPLHWQPRNKQAKQQQQQLHDQQRRRRRQLMMSDVGYQTRPRVVACFWPKDYDDQNQEDGDQETPKPNQRSDVNSNSNNNNHHNTNTKKKRDFVALQHVQVDPNMILPLSNRNIYVSVEAVKAQLHLENSKDYEYGRSDPFEEGDCVRQYEWQVTSYPTCNSLHEHPLWDMRSKRGSKVKFLASGYWRDTWMIRDDTWEQHALKTLRYMHEYEERNYDRHRRDAVAMEHLTSSPNVMSIYSYCGHSGVFEFADGGSLEDSIWYSEELEWNSTEKLIVAYQAVSGLADLHNIDGEGKASIAHTDIVPSQFVFVNNKGRFLLNDFNRCRFIAWNQKEDKACPFNVGSNPGTFRSPEEYRYDPETEKIDIYSLGNVFYALLMKQYPYEDLSKKEAQQRIMDGHPPPLAEKYNNTEALDPFTQALIKAMNMCWVYDPEQRATARQVEQFIDQELARLGVQGKPT